MLSYIVEANIDVDPNTLNDKSKGKWITVYIELPEGYDLNEIDLGSILLNNSLHIASSSPCEIGDYDGDGVPDLMVKFSLGEVQDMLAPGKNNIVITGELLDGTTFEGEDEIQFTINYNNENYTVLDNLINTSILSAGLICLVPVMKIIKKRK